jgi:ATP-dependent Lon protease
MSRSTRAVIKKHADDLKKLLPRASVQELKSLIGMSAEQRGGVLKRLKAIRGQAQGDSLRIKVLQSEIPEADASGVLQELEDFCGCEPDVEKYVRALTELPRVPKPIVVDDLGAYLTRGRAQLDACTMGQEALKETLMQIISERVTSPGSRPVALGIHGPAGVGKTALVRSGLARVLDLPFHTVSLGGLSDAAHMVGFERTYAGATYGRLAKIALASRCSNPVIFFDELDKISDTSGGREIANVLIHLTDPEGADTVHDKYLGPVDLRGATLVFAYNDPAAVSPILRSRLREVEVKGYSDKEKQAIARDHLVPSICAELEIVEGTVDVSDALIEHLVALDTSERGVRTLRQNLSAIHQAARVAVATRGEVRLGIPEACMAADHSRCALDIPAAREFCAKVCGAPAPRVANHMYT